MVKKGFTLVELIIVIVIIGILALIALPRIFSNIENARKSEALMTMRSIADAEKAYAASKSGSEIYTSWPITAVFDGVEAYNLSQPSSTNFDYSVTGTNIVDGQITAGNKSSSAGIRSYCRCTGGSNWTSVQGNGAACRTALTNCP